MQSRQTCSKSPSLNAGIAPFIEKTTEIDLIHLGISGFLSINDETVSTSLGNRMAWNVWRRVNECQLLQTSAHVDKAF